LIWQVRVFRPIGATEKTGREYPVRGGYVPPWRIVRSRGRGGNGWGGGSLYPVNAFVAGLQLAAF